jgi:hypothetical protein
MQTVETGIYDSLTSGKIDASKWQLLSFPMGNGQTWTWSEPNARIYPRDGGTAITVDPFTRKHDTVHMFDDPKQLYGSTRTFPISPSGLSIFEVEMAAETHRSNAEDLQDGFAGFILMDFTTGMIFDFIASSKKIGAIYERLLIPGVTNEETAFTHIIESPFSGVTTMPGQLHQYSIRIDPSNKKAEWFVDNKRFFKTEQVPAIPKALMIGFGLFTLKPVDKVKGSVSLHGQGATGVWKNFKYYTR